MTRNLRQRPFVGKLKGHESHEGARGKTVKRVHAPARQKMFVAGHPAKRKKTGEKESDECC